MKIAFVLYKYFPFGGVQRDCLHIAQVMQGRGHEVELLCIEWNGEEPVGIPVHRFSVRGITNHRRYRNFSKKIQRHCRNHAIDGVVGFNKMPGLDVYFAADGCYQQKSASKSHLYRLTPRYQYFLA
ncbi:MAG: glycosyltransferase, partial [Immundisolibacteraceae bacterium]|nr:glycosyltransferase [Immundisolibacteraceae bacterium]